MVSLNMTITKSIAKVRSIIKKQKLKNKIIGFVPTMGALHQGHLSLIKKARKDAGFLVVSIFVNPLQFGPKEDYRIYPRNFKKDRALLEKERVDLIFYPYPKNMYTAGFSTYVEETSLSKSLCGKSRPGHFRGVATVVTKLFNIVQPDIAYFGRKDYQQAQVIKRLTQDLNIPAQIRILPIIRQKSGLALSSRNAYLSQKEEKKALVLYQSLRLARNLVKQGQRKPHFIKTKIAKLINSRKNLKIDYIELVDPKTLKPVKKIDKKTLLALAIFVGKIRLIDNTII